MSGQARGDRASFTRGTPLPGTPPPVTARVCARSPEGALAGCECGMGERYGHGMLISTDAASDSCGPAATPERQKPPVMCERWAGLVLEGGALPFKRLLLTSLM